MKYQEIYPLTTSAEPYEKVVCIIVVNEKGDKERARMSRCDWAYLQWIEEQDNFDTAAFFIHCAKRFHDLPMLDVLAPCVAELHRNRDRKCMIGPAWCIPRDEIVQWWIDLCKGRIPPYC